MNRRKKGGFAAGCCVALLLITLCAAAGGGVLWYVGRTMAQPGSASMQGASGAPGGGAEDTGRQEPLFREGDTVDTVLAKMTLPLPGTGRGGEGCGIPFGRLYPVPGKF